MNMILIATPFQFPRLVRHHQLRDKSLKLPQCLLRFLPILQAYHRQPMTRKRRKCRRRKKRKKNSIAVLQYEALQTDHHHLYHLKCRLTNVPHHYLLYLP